MFLVLGGVPGFFGCSGMFRDVPGWSGVAMFRYSGVPVFLVPVFLEVLHAQFWLLIFNFCYL